MELLIPGLMIVGLMIYASTRIKKAARQALERETVETEHFSITKPEGFISVAVPEGDLVFHAYTKEFSDESSTIRKAEATIKEFATEAADEHVKDPVQPNAATDIIDDNDHFSETERTFCIEDELDGAAVNRYYKRLSRMGRTFTLEFVSPAGDLTDARREMMDSFKIKD